MKKRPPIPTLPGQPVPASKGRLPSPSRPSTRSKRSEPTPSEEHRAVSYVPGANSYKEPSILPRLFIQGFGGSVKMDLRGVGMQFSNAVFAFMVSDDTLVSIHVRRGDIALIEPVSKRLHHGALILLDLNGSPVIGRLRRQKSCWMLDSIDGKSFRPFVLTQHGIQGVVIGFLRPFDKLKPVQYEGTEASFSMNLETPSEQRGMDQAPSKMLRYNSRSARKSALTNPYRFLAFPGRKANPAQRL